MFLFHPFFQMLLLGNRMICFRPSTRRPAEPDGWRKENLTMYREGRQVTSWAPGWWAEQWTINFHTNRISLHFSFGAKASTTTTISTKSSSTPIEHRPPRLFLLLQKLTDKDGDARLFNIVIDGSACIADDAELARGGIIDKTKRKLFNASLSSMQSKIK